MQNKSPIWIVIAVIIAVVLFFMNRNKQPDRENVAGEGDFSAEELKLLTPVRVKTSVYKKYSSVSLVDNKRNDGDSFFVDLGGEEAEYRLYFVDTPESRLHQYNGKRIGEQGEYFGGLTQDQTIQAGKDGKAMTMSLLKKNPFTIYSKGQPVTNRADETRVHGFIVVHLGGDDYYLHELLVLKGLVRIYTWGSELPDGTAWKEQKKNLFKIEDYARDNKHGAWGM